MADKKDESGVEHFEEAAKTAETTSSDARFSEIKQAPSTGRLDGSSFTETRGEPKKD